MMNASRVDAKRGRARGFTLLEILVVMSLLSVVMLALGTALRTIAQTEERIDQRLDRADEMRIAVAFMRSTLGRVSARRITPPPPDTPRVMFTAGADAVTWVGVMPARYGAGGRYFFRLALEPAQPDAALVIRFVPWTDATAFPDWSAAESRALVRNVKSFSLRYQDGRVDPPLWSADWPLADRLPDQLQLDIETIAGAWPQVNLALRPLPASDSSPQGGAVFGGS